MNTRGTHEPPNTASASINNKLIEGVVIKLDRGYPLVHFSLPEYPDTRCEHATALVKSKTTRAVIGDRVLANIPEGHDKGIIEEILPRTSSFIRKDPAERTTKQVLAANFNLVIIAEPIVDLNLRRLERELVLAHETGVKVAIVLTKLDLVDKNAAVHTLTTCKDLAGKQVKVLAVSREQESTLCDVRQLIEPNSVAILIGKSGVGKSSLVNALAGELLQETAAVRTSDGKGRHTTVDRVLIPIPGGGAIVDMPGVRGLGLWNADQGLNRAFPDIEKLANSCRFRDCTHTSEPECAVQEAIRSQELSQVRLDSYQSLAQEIEHVRQKRDQARQLRGEKVSDRRAHAQIAGKGSGKKHSKQKFKRRLS